MTNTKNNTASELQGGLIKRGRKTFWVCGSAANEVQVRSTNGAIKSFMMNAEEAASLYVRPACAADFAPGHEKGAARMAGKFAAMGQRAELEITQAILAR